LNHWFLTIDVGTCFYAITSTFFLQTNKTIMKKIFAIACATSLFFACNDGDTTDEPIGSPDTATTNAGTVAPTSYTPVDGDVTYRDDKVMVMRNGQWVEADDRVTLENGAVVHKDGRIKKDDKEVKLEDGQVVNKEGDFFDRTGNAIENAWEDAKGGLKDAGKEIEKGAEKAGDKTEDAVDDDKK
jgi:hypothetical protein